ncbi:3-oxoacyl-[acyl-carrier protein] reductase [Acidisarcina polymorpha]|uniref:3-oxoacyl-[acyl-carrier protein] reductase n=1 Tax=Acidisarcina polymorpha TaxID=2211140 RepID=A0A2Z5G2F9_9BACT|nr:SDR family oxidoreductase [Acidisarcina polymorpha]AXC13311.1 3-oxoacyl-[acyl-carrier protein] reductase [Acidisarcina polymorpha]
MNISLRGKVAVVTGASSGIGLAITRAYLDAGIKGVVAVFRRNDLPEELQEALKTYPDNLIIVRGDVAVEQTAIDFTKVALDKFGSLDVFVSNAAISIVKAVHLHTEEEWDTVVNANVKSLYWAAKHVIPVMIEQKGGLILISGSISGEAGIPTQGAYAPSKGALHQMTRQMAIEYAKYGIRVNTVACGTVDTPIVHSSAKASGNPEGYWKMLKDAHPIGRIASAEEVAAFYTYMATDLASFFTGAILMMDGGYTAQ